MNWLLPTPGALEASSADLLRAAYPSQKEDLKSRAFNVFFDSQKFDANAVTELHFDNRSEADLVRDAAEVGRKAVEKAEDPVTKERNAQLILYAKIQRAFYVCAQTLVLFLAAVSALALVAFIVRLTIGDPTAAHIAVAGASAVASIASGGAASFLTRYAKDTGEAYKAALNRLDQYDKEKKAAEAAVAEYWLAVGRGDWEALPSIRSDSNPPDPSGTAN